LTAKPRARRTRSPHPLHDSTIATLVGMGPQIATTLVAERFAQHGVQLSPAERARLIKQLRKPGSADTFTVKRRGKNAHVNLILTPDDVRELEKRLDRLVEVGTSASVEGLDDTALGMLRNLKRRWPEEARWQQQDLNAFRFRLRERWSRPLDLLSLFLVVFRESGEAMGAALRTARGEKQPFSTDVLTRLHARACQVATEITTLLEAGFADGAMARWRTLHEIAVVAFFVQDGGEDVAERYVHHQVVESRRAAQKHEKVRERLHEKPIAPTKLARLEKVYRVLLDRYKKPFRAQYGWAADKLGKDRPDFSDIEAAVNIDHLRPYYQLASHPVHANPKGIYFKLGLLGESDMLMAGASNYGLAEPGQQTVLSLAQIASALMTAHATIDAIVAVKILRQLGQEAAHAFARVQRTIEREERRRTRRGAKRRAAARRRKSGD
jgi:hypothetical protein